MIKFQARFDEYAYRIANLPLATTEKTVEEGQFVTIKNGEVVLATKTDTKAFLCIGSKREGRDQVSGKIVKNISFLHGAFFGLEVTNFDSMKDYSGGIKALTFEDGKLKPVEAPGTDLVVAYSLGAPVGGYLKIMSA